MLNLLWQLPYDWGLDGVARNMETVLPWAVNIPIKTTNLDGTTRQGNVIHKVVLWGIPSHQGEVEKSRRTRIHGGGIQEKSDVHPESQGHALAIQRSPEVWNTDVEGRDHQNFKCHWPLKIKTKSSAKFGDAHLYIQLLGRWRQENHKSNLSWQLVRPKLKVLK